MKNIIIFQQFLFVRSNYNSKPISDVICFVTLGVERSIISSDSNLTQNIIRNTIEVKKKEIDQDRILAYSRVNDSYFQITHSLLL